MSDTAYSVVTPGRRSKQVAAALVIVYALVTMIPLAWIFLTGFKSGPELDQLPAQGLLPADARGLLQPLHLAQPPDRGLPQQPAAGDIRLRPDRPRALDGHRRPLEILAALRQLAGHRLRLDLPRRHPRHARRLRLLPLPRAARRRPPLLHPLHPDDAADRRRDPHLPHVPRGRPHRHPPRHDPALHRRERQPRRLAAQGLHRRDPARIRGSRHDRRLLPPATPSSASCSPRPPPASPPPRSSA